MEEMKFHSLNELYKRLLPAIKCRVNDLKARKITYIHEEDIWNCLKEQIWSRKSNLALYNMVDDILNTPSEIFENYVKDIIKNEHRRLSKDDNNEL